MYFCLKRTVYQHFVILDETDKKMFCFYRTFDLEVVVDLLGLDQELHVDVLHEVETPDDILDE